MIKDNTQNVHLDFPWRCCRRETSGILLFFLPWVWLVPFAMISYETYFQSCYKKCICKLQYIYGSRMTVLYHIYFLQLWKCWTCFWDNELSELYQQHGLFIPLI
jgi:hypothetical protein